MADARLLQPSLRLLGIAGVDIDRHDLEVRPAETRYDYELAFLLGALTAGFRVASVAVPTIYEGRPSHFRALGDTWRLARVFGRYGGHIVRGA